MTFIWAIIVGLYVYVQGAINMIFDGLPIPFSDHVGKVIEVGPIANSQKINKTREWEEKYSRLFIGEKVVYANSREEANFKKITAYQKYEVIRVKYKTESIGGRRSYIYCILKNFNNPTDYLIEECDSLDVINHATEKYKSILKSIREGKIKYFALSDVSSTKGLKKIFNINDYNVFELKNENQVDALINVISSEKVFPSYIELSKLNEIIFLNQDDLKNDKVLSQLILTNKNKYHIVTKKEELEKVYAGSSDLLKQESFVQRFSELNDRIAIRIYFNYFNQKIKDYEKMSKEDLNLAFNGLVEIKNCLSVKYFSDQKLSPNIFNEADKILFNNPILQSKIAIFLSKRTTYNIERQYDCYNFKKFSEVKVN